MAEIWSLQPGSWINWGAAGFTAGRHRTSCLLWSWVQEKGGKDASKHGEGEDSLDIPPPGRGTKYRILDL